MKNWPNEPPAEQMPTARATFSGGAVRRITPEHRAEGGGRQADADQDVAQDQHRSVMHGGGDDHAQHIEHAAAGDGRRGAEPVGEAADEGREEAHQQHRQGSAEGKQLAADV